MKQPDLNWRNQEVRQAMHAVMRTLTDRYGQRLLIGEISVPMERLMAYYGEQLDEIHLPFNFQFVSLPTWEADKVRQIVETYEATLP